MSASLPEAIPSDEHLRAVLSSLAVGVISRDRERRILYLNERAEALTGVCRATARGVACRDLLCHRDQAGRSQCGSHCPAEACLDGEEGSRRLWLRAANGERLAVVSRFTRLRDAAGETVGTVESFDLAGDRFTPAGELSIDLEQRRVCLGGAPVRLTRTEFDLLACLARAPERAVSHAALLQQVWGPECEGQTQYLHTFIGQLRRKLETDPRHPRYIITEARFGYRLCLGGEPAAGESPEGEEPSS